MRPAALLGQDLAQAGDTGGHKARALPPHSCTNSLPEPQFPRLSTEGHAQDSRGTAPLGWTQQGLCLRPSPWAHAPVLEDKEGPAPRREACAEKWGGPPVPPGSFPGVGAVPGRILARDPPSPRQPAAWELARDGMRLPWTRAPPTAPARSSLPGPRPSSLRGARAPQGPAARPGGRSHRVGAELG